MRILFITSSRIGDAVLSTGLLDHLYRTHPDAKVTVVCGPLTTSLFEGYPALDRIIALKKQPYNAHWLGLWKQVVGTRWDMVVDLRNSIVTRAIRANHRFIYGKHIDRSHHKVRQAAAIMRLDTVPAPNLWPTQAQTERANALIPNGTPVIGIGPTANWIGKTWPVERFIDVAQWILSEKMPNARIAVFAAPGEESVARVLYDSLPDTNRINIIAKTTPGEAAACLARCDYYIGNDSGLMHCAAAVGTKTLGLFGPSYPHLYAPYGDHCRHVSTPETYDELTAYDGYTPDTAPCLMTTLSTEAVIDGLDRVMSE